MAERLAAAEQDVKALRAELNRLQNLARRGSRFPGGFAMAALVAFALVALFDSRARTSAAESAGTTLKAPFTIVDSGIHRYHR
jgi:hypothetical protein